MKFTHRPFRTHARLSAAGRRVLHDRTGQTCLSYPWPRLLGEVGTGPHAGMLSWYWSSGVRTTDITDHAGWRSYPGGSDFSVRFAPDTHFHVAMVMLLWVTPPPHTPCGNTEEGCLELSPVAKSKMTLGILTKLPGPSEPWKHTLGTHDRASSWVRAIFTSPREIPPTVFEVQRK